QFGAPQSYLNNSYEKLGLTGVKFVNLRARLIGLENFVQGDQYTLLRDIYLQNRQFKGTTTGSSDTPLTTPNTFGEDGFGDSDFDQQKSQNTDPTVTPTEQNAADTTQTSIPLDTAIVITADTPMDPSATVMLAQSVQF
ncbi:MAG TPA: MlaA family lipoprotein, partial [Aquirhabdus sp.]